MTEVLKTPNMQAAVVGWLPDALASAGIAGVKVGTKLPATIPPLHVRIVLTGGSGRNKVTDVVQLTFESRATDDVKASDLAATVHALVRALAGTDDARGVWVRKVEEVGLPQDLPDPDTNGPRYISTLRLHVRPT